MVSESVVLMLLVSSVCIVYFIHILIYYHFLYMYILIFVLNTYSIYTLYNSSHSRTSGVVRPSVWFGWFSIIACMSLIVHLAIKLIDHAVTPVDSTNDNVRSDGSICIVRGGETTTENSKHTTLFHSTHRPLLSPQTQRPPLIPACPQLQLQLQPQYQPSFLTITTFIITTASSIHPTSKHWFA